MALCPPCHARTDAPYARGRLVITPLGDGRFTLEITRAGAPEHEPADRRPLPLSRIALTPAQLEALGF